MKTDALLDQVIESPKMDLYFSEDITADNRMSGGRSL
jgi:hypothetical protein